MLFFFFYFKKILRAWRSSEVGCPWWHCHMTSLDTLECSGAISFTFLFGIVIFLTCYINREKSWVFFLPSLHPYVM